MTIKFASANSVIIYFDNKISKKTSLEVKAAYSKLTSLKNSSFIEIIPSYCSIFILYDIFKFDFNSLKEYLLKELKEIKKYDLSNQKLIDIDVFYSSEVGFDLEEVAIKSSMTISEVINTHSSKLYDVYSIGFLPGFAYLAQVDEKIAMPRLETPRKVVPKGSIAIADFQTAIYPSDSPGGWNIIGKTAFECFDKKLDDLSLIDINSRIRFNPISKEEFLTQGGKIEF